MMRATHLFLAVLLAGAHGAHAAAVTENVTATAETQEDSLYAQGTKAMDEQRWTDALDAFDKVAATKGKKADAALYWKAYSLNKLNRREEAGAVCGQLRGQYAESTWNKECRVLQVRTAFDGQKVRIFARTHDGQMEPKILDDRAALDAQLAELNMNLGQLQTWTMDGSNFKTAFKSKDATEDDIKLLALNSLMQSDPAKGIPLMRDVAKSNKSLELRKQAMFALARSKRPEAQQTITEMATTKGDPDLQRWAVQLLPMSRGKEADGTLVEIYRNTTDPKVKRAAVSGLYSAHDATRLVELARSEKDLNLKRDIVSQLSVMKDQAATDYMMELLK